MTMRSVWSGTVNGVGGFLRPKPLPPIILGGFGPKMAELAGRIADGVNLSGGPNLAHLLEVARRARAESGRDPEGLVVTVSSDLRASSLERLEELGVGRVVAFVQAPSSDRVHRLSAARRN
jgi:alkanesulfonate monooxygenase SsuD/methylene tetrahydromethanopterin reductase-like flavin-dependent oxidoreductase (luciferase family)